MWYYRELIQKHLTKNWGLYLFQVIFIFGFFWEHLSVQQSLFRSILVLLTHYTVLLHFLAILNFPWILYACPIFSSRMFQFDLRWVVSQHIFVLILIICRTSFCLIWRCYFDCRILFFFRTYEFFELSVEFSVLGFPSMLVGLLISS